MSKVALVTDSTATIPADLLSKHNIHVAPQVLIWNGDTMEDGVDIQPAEFYARLKTAKTMPSSSQVTPKAFRKIFMDLLEQDFQVLAILISEKLSGTIASACQVKEMLPEAPIEIVDSHTVAMAMGFQLIEVAKAAEQGASLAECVRLAEEARQHTGVIFAVDTLEFLHRGGRIGGATRYLGTALNIKPILEVVDGRVEPIERVRTRRKSLERLVELVQERTAGKQPIRLASLHTNVPEDARLLMEMVSARVQAVEMVYSEVSPVVGTHAGPGTVGMAWMAGM